MSAATLKTVARCVAGYVFLNSITSLLLTPFFGIPSGVYKLHHRIMHHVVSSLQHLVLVLHLQNVVGVNTPKMEPVSFFPIMCLSEESTLILRRICMQEDNGAPRDLSSTEPYQRDSILHFLLCGPCLPDDGRVSVHAED